MTDMDRYSLCIWCFTIYIVMAPLCGICNYVICQSIKGPVCRSHFLYCRDFVVHWVALKHSIIRAPVH